MAPTDAQAGRAWMARADGLTGYTGPVKPSFTRFATICEPIVRGFREAPMTATERGRRIGSSVRGIGAPAEGSSGRVQPPFRPVVVRCRHRPYEAEVWCQSPQSCWRVP